MCMEGFVSSLTHWQLHGWTEGAAPCSGGGFFGRGWEWKLSVLLASPHTATLIPV